MSTQSIELIVPAALNVEVETDVSTVEVETVATTAITVENGISQQNLWVGKTKPVFSGPGIWIETGLGDGTGWTMWIEDGR